MKAVSKNITRIHEQAVRAAANFKRSQVELLKCLEEADQHRVFTSLGFNSLFVYAVKGLKLEENIAYVFIKVARKMREVPALKDAIASGAVTVYKAKRISSVLTKENQSHWLKMAASCSKKKLEQLVAEENPREAVSEKTSFVSKDRLELLVGVSSRLMLKLRRAQDLLSQKRRRAVSLEEVLEVFADGYLQRNDPVDRAQRQMIRGKLAQTEKPDERETKQLPRALGPGPAGKKRAPIPAATRHKLNIKFSGRCAHFHPDGNRCGERRFLDIHHIRPLSQGGTDDLGNLELLCSGHHRARHS